MLSALLKSNQQAQATDSNPTSPSRSGLQKTSDNKTGITESKEQTDSPSKLNLLIKFYRQSKTRSPKSQSLNELSPIAFFARTEDELRENRNRSKSEVVSTTASSQPIPIGKSS